MEIILENTSYNKNKSYNNFSFLQNHKIQTCILLVQRFYSHSEISGAYRPIKKNTTEIRPTQNNTMKRIGKKGKRKNEMVRKIGRTVPDRQRNTRRPHEAKP